MKNGENIGPEVEDFQVIVMKGSEDLVRFKSHTFDFRKNALSVRAERKERPLTRKDGRKNAN